MNIYFKLKALFLGKNIRNQRFIKIMSSYDHIVQDIGLDQSNDDNNKSTNF